MTSDVQRFLAFTLCNEKYAIPLLTVKEVIALTEITPIPYAPSYFKGIMNLRGQIISVIDLRLKFQMSKAETNSETAILILDLSPICLGVIIDSVDSVLALEATEISPPPVIEDDTKADYITGVARKDSDLVLLMDITKVLKIEDMKLISKAAA